MDTLDRFQALEAGQYWKATSSIDSEEIPCGTVLLIESIKWVDGAAHTIVLRPHPLAIAKSRSLHGKQHGGTSAFSHKFLVKDFLLNFEFEPDFERIRQEELSQVQRKVDMAQQELVQVQQNPGHFNQIINEKLADDLDEAPYLLSHDSSRDDELPAEKRGDLSHAIGTGVTEQSISRMKKKAELQGKIATIQQEWLSERTESIGRYIASMTPFYEEKAAAAIAKTEAVTTHVEKIKNGIESLDLYLGKGVDVHRIKEGRSADKNIPLTFCQQKLVMDEELAVWANVDESFDFASTRIFENHLSESEGLADQIFPTERCVVAIAATRRFLDYGNIFQNIAMARENWKVCLLVRDGENIYRITSPVESHLGAHRLFPSRNEHDEVFQGIDGKNVNFEDIAYTEKLSDHEAMSLHYKRFLILICGLDHHHKLFGQFYEGPCSLNFISLEFQRANCRFIYDDDSDASLSPEKRKRLASWVTEQNKMLHKGATVLVRWSRLLTPSRCSKVTWRNTTEDSLNIPFSMESDISLQKVISRKGKLVVTPTVRFDSGRIGKVTVALETPEDELFSDVDYLCIDYVKAEDIRPYIYQRSERSRNFQHLQFLKEALRLIEDRQPARDTLENYISGRLEAGAANPEMASAIFCAWSASLAGQEAPNLNGIEHTRAGKKLNTMISIASSMPHLKSNLMSKVRACGRDLLRVSCTGQGKLVTYESPALHERCDEVEEQAWVWRVERNKNPNLHAISSETFVSLLSHIPTEVELWRSPQDDQWINASSCFRSHEEKVQALDAVKSGWDIAEVLLCTEGIEDLKKLIEAYLIARDNLTLAKMLNEPGIAIPIGIQAGTRKGDWEYICIANSYAFQVLHYLPKASGSADLVREAMVCRYANKTMAKDRYDNIVESPLEWSLRLISVGDYKIQGTIFSSVGRGLAKQDLLFSPDHVEAEINKLSRPNKTIWTHFGDFRETLPELLSIGEVTRDHVPCTVCHYKVDETTTASGRYREWIDVIPGDIVEENKSLSAIEWASLSHEGVNGVSLSSYKRPHKERAVTLAHELASRLGKNFYAAKHLEEAPNPPEGVLRFYLI